MSNSNFSLPPFSMGVRYSLSWDKLFTLEEIDEFVYLYERTSTSEQELHAYLKQHPKFLFALGAYDAAASEVTFPSRIQSDIGERMRLRLDFLLRDQSGFWDVVELKRADFGDISLIVGQAQRRRFALAIEDAIAQVKTYLRELDETDAQMALLRQNILVEQPQAWLIVGRDKYLPSREKRLLERDLPHPLRIVTYDELCSLAKQRAVILSSTILLPFVDPRIGLSSDRSEKKDVIEPVLEQLDIPRFEYHRSFLDIPAQQALIAAIDGIKSDRSQIFTVRDLRTEHLPTRQPFQNPAAQLPRDRTLVRPFMGKLKRP